MAHTLKRNARRTTLSARERHVLDGIWAGQSSREIASRHGLSEGTVRMYRSGLRRKFAAANVAALLRIALNLKLIHLP